MTRGRKKDHTAPLTKALIVQRDYRARKAQYVSELEDRCNATEEENVRLRKELELARAGVPSILSAETAQASKTLMQHLATASASLAQFQRLALSASASWNPPPTNSSVFHPVPVPCPCPPPLLAGESSSTPVRYDHVGSYGQNGSGMKREDPPPRHTLTPDLSLGPECCGGYIDCHGLLEDKEDQGVQQMGDLEYSDASMTKTSGVRSTSYCAAACRK